jgi:hypothetical protein
VSFLALHRRGENDVYDKSWPEDPETLQSCMLTVSVPPIDRRHCQLVCALPRHEPIRHDLGWNLIADLGSGVCTLTYDQGKMRRIVVLLALARHSRECWRWVFDPI